VPLPKGFSRKRIIKLVLVVAGFLFIGFGFFADLSSAFPERMRIAVFYDDAGISGALRQFSEVEKKELGIAPQWEGRQTEYDEVIRRSLATLWQQYDSAYVADTTHVNRRQIHADGEATFELERLGFLYYRVKESKGMLQQSVGSSGAVVEPFWTFFSLNETPSSYMRANLLRLLRHPSVVLRPEFRQMISLDSRGRQSRQFDHVVTGATKVRLFPYPRFESTLYLWEAPDGRAVPIGYALYYPFE
jgi:hypothetical protein